MVSRKHCIAIINASVPKNLPIAFAILQPGKNVSECLFDLRYF